MIQSNKKKRKEKEKEQKEQYHTYPGGSASTQQNEWVPIDWMLSHQQPRSHLSPFPNTRPWFVGKIHLTIRWLESQVGFDVAVAPITTWYLVVATRSRSRGHGSNSLFNRTYFFFFFFFFYLRYSCLQKYGVARLFFFFSQCVWFRAWGSMVDTVFLGSWAIGWFLGRMFFP